MRRVLPRLDALMVADEVLAPALMIVSPAR